MCRAILFCLLELKYCDDGSPCPNGGECNMIEFTCSNCDRGYKGLSCTECKYMKEVDFILKYIIGSNTEKNQFWTRLICAVWNG